MQFWSEWIIISAMPHIFPLCLDSCQLCGCSEKHSNPLQGACINLGNFRGHFTQRIKRAYKNIRDAWKMKCEVCENQSSSPAPCLPVLKAVQVSWWMATDLSLLTGKARLFSCGFVCFLAILPAGIMIQGWIFVLCSLKAQWKILLDPAQLRR